MQINGVYKYFDVRSTENYNIIFFLNQSVTICIRWMCVIRHTEIAWHLWVGVVLHNSD